MRIQMFVLVFCMAVVTPQTLNKADIKDILLKQLLLRSKFERSNSEQSSGNGNESNGSESEPGSGSESSGSGSGSGSGSSEDCFGIGNKEKLESISNALQWMNDEYSNSVLEEDFTQLQGVQELIGYLIVVEEHHQYAVENYLARHLRDLPTKAKKDMA